MSTNISKYVQLSDFLLLEYEFNRDEVMTSLYDSGIDPIVAVTEFGTKQYFNKPIDALTNNSLKLQSIPTDEQRANWYINPDNTTSYYNFFDSSTNTKQDEYRHDTVKVHIVSGYNFDDIGGFLLQIRAEASTGELVDISNFTWIKQVLGNTVLKFSSEPLYLGNRFYDKYTELNIPSIQILGGDTDTSLGQELEIKPLSDVYLQYSTIPEVDNYQYLISEKIQVQLPVVSNADNFNCFIAESTSGDYIEYYGTWNDIIIGEYMGDIESGRISLYTSNNPNDNYQEFIDEYGITTAKWVIIHEIQVKEQFPGANLLTQKFQFTQEDNFLIANKFRPVIINSDIDTTYTIEYICRLMNRMDGSQIIRKASFASTDPKKYGNYFDRINVENYIPYKVFNHIPGEVPNIIQGSGVQRTKFTKVFYDTTNILLNTNNEVLPQGTGHLFLKNGDSLYKMKFEKINQNTDPPERINVDLSGVFNYGLLFILDDDTKIEIPPSYSTNMNTALGELEFKLTGDQVSLLLKQTNNKYSITVKNPDGTQYSFYEGLYYDYGNFNEVIAEYKEFFNIDSLNTKIADLESQVKVLTDENAALKT